MTAAGPPRRIVVAVDSSAHARAAMEAATDLALRLRAEITALFVEDIDLIRLASLPFAREIGRDAAVRPFDALQLERRMRSEARQAREACAKAAERSRTVVHFEVARGVVAREILAAAEHAEIVVLGRAGAQGHEGAESGRRATPLGSTALSVLAASTGTVAIVTAQRGVGRPVAVVYDGSDAARRALDLGVRLAGEDHRNLVVLIPGADPAAERLAVEAAAGTRQAGIVPRCVLLGDGVHGIAAAVSDHDCRALVIDRNCPRLEADNMRRLVEGLDCPVFVVG